MEPYRLDYKLNPDSVVFDLGGYKGQWTKEISDKFRCTVYCFEIIQDYIRNLKNMFSGNPKIRVFPYGLANCSFKSTASKINDSSSLYKGELTEDVQLVDIADFLNSEKVDFIDLMKINIEGAEYDLLDYIIKKGLVSRLGNIQVQFHSFYPNAHERAKKIQQELLKTHKLTYQTHFVWENWEIRS